MTPLIFHIPHSSTVVPAEVRKSLLLDGAALEAELLRMTDHWTDTLFDVPGVGAELVIFPVSRLVVDPERFADDAGEPMAARGMGAVYEKTADLRPLRKTLSAEGRRALIDRFYRPHHHLFSRWVGRALARCARCLIVDCHSFPSSPLPYECDQSPDRPEICIGTDAFHTPGPLATEAVVLFEKAGFRTAVNRPFAGAIVPMEYYCRDPAVSSIMIEVNRSQYMDEKTCGRLPAFANMQLRLAGCLARLAEVFKKMGRTT